MTVKLHLVRKQIIVEYDKSVVKGQTVSAQAGKPGGEVLEKKTSKNSGGVTFSFGAAFTGPVEIAVKGSASGTDSGEVVVP